MAVVGFYFWIFLSRFFVALKSYYRKQKENPFLIRILGEESLGVAEEEDIVTLDAVDLAPGVHDPRVVRRDNGNDIDALALQLTQLLNVGRKVVRLAAGCERAGDGDHNDLLARPLLGGIVLLGKAAGSGVSVCDRSPPVTVSTGLVGDL